MPVSVTAVLSGAEAQAVRNKALLMQAIWNDRFIVQILQSDKDLPRYCPK